jgi:hypothetical protein
MSESYPRPDRSKTKRNFERSEKNQALDIGWQEGRFRDGRPYRAEYWTEERVSVLTFFFSTIGLENNRKDEFVLLLEREVSLTFRSKDQIYLDAGKLVDPSGHEMWSVNVVVGDDDGTFVEGGPQLNRYTTKPPSD